MGNNEKDDIDNMDIGALKLKIAQESAIREKAELERNYIFVIAWIVIGSLLSFVFGLHPVIGFGIGLVTGWVAGTTIAQNHYNIKLGQ